MNMPPSFTKTMGHFTHNVYGTGYKVKIAEEGTKLKEERPSGEELERNGNELKSKKSIISVGQASVDFETAITYAGYGKFNYFLMFMMLTAVNSSAYDTAAMSYILPVATCELKLSSFDKGCLNSITYAGMICSAFLWGFLSDTLGRQKLLGIGYFLDVLMTIGASLSQSFWAILLFKFCSGFIICGPHSIFMAYISEVFNGKYRDRVILSTGFCMAIGQIIHPMIAYFLVPQKISWVFLDGAIVINSWRLFMLVSGLPSLISGTLAVFCVESPKFLMAQGRKEEALKVFRTIYTLNTGKPEDTYPVRKLRDERRQSAIQRTAQAPVSSNKTGQAMLRGFQQVTTLFRPPHVSRAFFVFFIQTGSLMSMNILRLWVPQLFARIKQMPESLSKKHLTVCDVLEANITQPTTNCEEFHVDDSIYVNMICVATFTATMFLGSSFLIRHISKKYIIIVTFYVASICTCLIAWSTTDWVLYLAIIYIAFLNVNQVAVVGIAVEQFPTSLRTMAVSLTMMFGRCSTLIGNLTFPFFLSKSCWLPFILLGVVAAICGTVMFYLPTTPKPGPPPPHERISIISHPVSTVKVNMEKVDEDSQH